MKRPAIATLLLALAIPASAFGAGGLVQTLPKDGSWTKYYCEAESPQEKFTGTMVVKSVGRTVENGKPCRWIEFAMTRTDGGKERRRVTKLLIDEASLKPGSKKVPAIIRGWKKNAAESRVEELSERDKDPANINGATWFLFGGSRKTVKTLKQAKTIDFQKGQLKIAEGKSATLEIVPRTKNSKGNVKFQVEQSFWTHKSVPFATAASEWTITLKSGDKAASKMKMKLTAQEYGTGAKSALPEKN